MERERRRDERGLALRSPVRGWWPGHHTHRPLARSLALSLNIPASRSVPPLLTCKLFAASGLESTALSADESLNNHMGLFLQKTNIIRDYLEDILEEPAPR